LDVNVLTKQVIGASIEVHRSLGPGLLESSYEECLCHELMIRQIPFERQYNLPLVYKGKKLDSNYRIDLLIDNRVVVELKATERILPIHEAQLLSYMKHGNWKIGLIVNFNVPVLKQGIRRKIID
jgi:GxxExxY protein